MNIPRIGVTDRTIECVAESSSRAAAGPAETIIQNAAATCGSELHSAPANAPEIPGYAITGEIAKGGMGKVYAALDLTLNREVAIKMLLPGAQADRFLAEAKITARLPHPCIPPIHALGTASDGTPFLAMKLIRGRTLADELTRRESTGEVLSGLIVIFEQIAQAVGFAHSQAIVHRDLKPLNVMVGEFGEVQVMDWGLARQLSAPEELSGRAAGSLDATPAQTLAGSVMGTPGYMAPEQARGEAVDVRADVFALGAILATILTGQPAFAGTTVFESIRMAANADLSTTFSRLDDCGQDPELIAIAKQCLAADRMERPADGSAVAARIAWYRAGVDARFRQSEADRAEAVVREQEGRKRRRQLLTAAIVVTVVLLAGLSASLWQMRRAVVAEQRALEHAAEARRAGEATEEARQAEAKRAEGERLAREQAEKNLEFARNANETLGNVFAALDPAANYQTVAELRNALKTNLNSAAESIERSSPGSPLEVAHLQDTLGRSLQGLGEAVEAAAILEKALAARKQLLGADDPLTIGSRGMLAESYRAAGMPDKAIPLYEEALQLAERRLGAEHSDTLASMNNLAVGYHSAGLLDKALPLYERTLQIRRRNLGVQHPDTLASMNNLAAACFSQGNFAAAIPLYEETYAVMKELLGAEHLSTLTSMNNLGAVYIRAESCEKAIPLFAESLALRRRQLGPDHPETLTTLRNLGIAYCKTGAGESAAETLEEFVALQRKQFPEADPGFAALLEKNATDLLSCRQYVAAETMLRECLAIRESAMPDQWPTFHCCSLLGGALLGQDRHAEAEPLLLRGYDGLQTRASTIPPAATSRLPESLDRLIEFYRSTGRDEERAKYEATRATLNPQPTAK
ncbi:MAG: hypothetical protein RL215_2985 [Planctomycetota bacterium]